MNIYIYTYIYVCVYMCIHIYTYIYIYNICMYITRCNTLTHAATALKRRAADAHKQHAYASACCNTLTHAATR